MSQSQLDGGLLLPGHDVPLGRYTVVRRLLPQRARRMVGAWCFVDHFGPDDVTGRPGMRIGPQLSCQAPCVLHSMRLLVE